jgi:c(7)-type cytochrome triheme protein
LNRRATTSANEREADEHRVASEGAPRPRAGSHAARRRERRSLFVVALIVVAVFAVSAISSSRADSRRASDAGSNAARGDEPPDAQDYSKFSHASRQHASLACDSCHRRAAGNSAAPRLPGHKACTDCHLPQFVTPNAPLCSICHASVEGENPPVKNFPALLSFNARFDHAQHATGAARPAQGCAACHQTPARRAAALSIPAGTGAHAECYTCHKPDAQAAGRDIASCGVCHAPAARYARTPASAPAFSVGFSHAAHGARQRLACADCHQTRAGLPQSQQVTAPRAAEHFATPAVKSCASCHDGRRAFGEAGFADCRRCHRGPTFRGG